MCRPAPLLSFPFWLTVKLCRPAQQLCHPARTSFFCSCSLVTCDVRHHACAVRHDFVSFRFDSNAHVFPPWLALLGSQLLYNHPSSLLSSICIQILHFLYQIPTNAMQLGVDIHITNNTNKTTPTTLS